MNPQIIGDCASASLCWILRASLQAAVLVGLVLLLQWAFGRFLSARWRANLWLIVLLRLLIPVLPASPISLFNLLHLMPAEPAHTQSLAPQNAISPPPTARMPQHLALSQPPAPDPAEPAPTNSGIHIAYNAVLPPPSQLIPRPESTPSSPFALTWPAALPLLYLAIVVLLSLRVVLATIRLSSTVRRLAPITDPSLLQLLQRCKDQMHIRRRVTLLAAPNVSVPALMGVLHPRLLIPPDLLTTLDPRELRLVFLHELGHIRRHDVALNWLATALQILHFFNPILYLAFWRMRGDHELACDELVLQQAPHDDRHAYGQTILKLLQSLSRRNVVPGMVGILEGTHLTRRITMIARFNNTRGRWSSLAFLSLMLLAAVALTDAVRGQANPAANTTPTTKPAKAPPTVRPAAMDSSSGAPTPRRPGYSDPRAGTGNPSGRLPAGPYGMTPGSPAMPGGPQNPRAVAPVLPTDEQSEKANAKTRDLLRKTINNVAFTNVSLRDAIDFIRDATGANFFVDWLVLESQGIAADAIVNVTLKDVPAWDALQLALRSVNAQITCNIENGIVVISNQQSGGAGVIKAYDVADLVEQVADNPSAGGPMREGGMSRGGRQPQPMTKMDQLIDLITVNVDPSCWLENGGKDVIKPFNAKLIITTTETNHRKIEKVLAVLRDKPDKTPNPK
ncbi:MAG: M48 family metalloprotease [Planctomycetota bacterium]|nr:M48 family metalloprotease [Planctomycetota bacterium]